MFVEARLFPRAGSGQPSLFFFFSQRCLRLLPPPAVAMLVSPPPPRVRFFSLLSASRRVGFSPVAFSSSQRTTSGEIGFLAWLWGSRSRQLLCFFFLRGISPALRHLSITPPASIFHAFQRVAIGAFILAAACVCPVSRAQRASRIGCRTKTNGLSRKASTTEHANLAITEDGVVLSLTSVSETRVYTPTETRAVVDVYHN